MRNIYRKSISILIAVCMLAAPGFVFAENSDVHVDETVYALLSAEGAIKEIETVVRIDSPNEDFKYYGDFDEIAGLTPGIGYEYRDGVFKPEKQNSGEAVYFSLKCQGELPVTMDIRHFMDEEEISPVESAGSKGKYRMEIEVKPNPEADFELAQNFMAQIQLRVDTSIAWDIKSPGAVQIVAGRYLQLAWTVMPGSDKTFYVEYETENLKTEDLSVTLAGSEGMIPSEFEELSTGLEQLDGGMVMVLDALKQIEAGLGEGVSGLGELESGAEKIYAGFERFIDSFDIYGTGLKEYVGSVSSIGAAIGKSADGLKSTSEGLVKLSDSYSTLESGYSQTTASVAELASMAGLMAEGGDEKSIALHNGLEAALKGLEELNVGFSESNNAMQEASGGASEISKGLEGINAGFSRIDGAGEELLSGFDEMKKGLIDTSFALEGLQQGILSSKEGFEEILSGFVEANESYSDLNGAVAEMNNRIRGLFKREPETISFTDTRNDIDSLQFFVNIRGIEPQENNNIKEETDQVGFWKRLWEKLKALF